MAANWLQNLLITTNELLDPVLFLRSVMNSNESSVRLGKGGLGVREGDLGLTADHVV